MPELNTDTTGPETGVTFTPGPWEKFAIRVRTAEGQVLAVGHAERGMDFPEVHANVQLMAAAPDLYEVVRRYVSANIGGTHLLKSAAEALAKAVQP